MEEVLIDRSLLDGRKLCGNKEGDGFMMLKVTCLTVQVDNLALDALHKVAHPASHLSLFFFMYSLVFTNRIMLSCAYGINSCPLNLWL